MRSALAAAAFLIAIAGVAGEAAAQEMDLMELADANKDGKVSAAEFSDFSEQGWDYFSQGAPKVKVAELDPMAKGAFVGTVADAGGFVDRAAYMAAIPTRFKAADKNGDGALDAAELKASLAPPAN